jgi:hypothetical protein
MGARSTIDGRTACACDLRLVNGASLHTHSVNRLFTLWRVADLHRSSIIEIQRVAVFSWRRRLMGMTCVAPNVEDLQFATNNHCTVHCGIVGVKH